MKKLLALLLTLCLALGVCLSASAEAPVALDGSWPEEKVKIGMLTFDTSDEVYLGLQEYYESLKDAFNIEFMYSESIADAAAEFAFIDACAAAGCKGIIAYYNVAGAEAIKECTSKGMYYWGIEQFYEEVKNDPYYVGCYTFMNPEDPSAHNGDYLGGYALGYALGTQGRKHVVFCSGGAAFGVQMFIDRQDGFFAGIAAAQAEGSDVVCDPEKDVIAGWPGTDDFAAAQTAALAADYDAVASSFNVAMWFQPVMESGKDIKLASIGRVSDTYKAFVDMGVVTALVYDCEEVVFGAAIPAILNSVTGHTDLVRNADGSAMKNYTQRWIVTDATSFDAIYDLHAQGKFFVTPEQVASALGALNPDATMQTVVDVYNQSMEDALATPK